MTEIFGSYQQEVSRLLTGTRDRLDAFSHMSNLNKQDTLAAFQTDSSQIESLCKRMEVEIGTLPQSKKNELTNRVRQYKREHLRLQKRIKAVESEYVNEKNFNKLAEGNIEMSTHDGEDQATSKYKKGLEHLKEGLRAGYEIEEMGIDAQRQLEAHTGLLERNIGRGQRIRQSLQESGRLIKGMMGRIAKNKYVLVGVVAIILSTIFIIVYLKVPHKQ